MTDEEPIKKFRESVRTSAFDEREQMPTIYTDRATNTIADLVPMPQFLASAPPGSMLITRINVPIKVRGQGHGSAILRRICADADRLGVVLYVQPISSGQWTNRTLRAWYTRHGFRYGRDYYTRQPRERTN